MRVCEMPRVQFINRDTTITPFLVDDAYRFRAKGKLSFLQKWVWKFLHKTKALNPHYENKVTVERFIVDTDNFIETLMRQRSDLRYNYGEEPAIVLIGGEDFSKMMSKPEVCQIIDFNSQVHYRDGRVGHKIMDLQIKVIPWMKGVITMPRGVL
jgi:hypothetical protein